MNDGQNKLTSKQLCVLAKEELSEKPLFSRTEKLAFLSALIFSSGSLIMGRGEVSVKMTTESEALVKAVCVCTESVIGRAPVVSGNLRKDIEIPHAASLLLDACVLTEKDGEIAVYEGIAPLFTTQAAAAYVRGAFAGAGSLTSEKYHLEFTFGSRAIADDFLKLLEQISVHGKLAVRKERAVVYVKDGEEICDCLALMGAGKACLQLNAIMAERHMSGEMNRKRNCDLYNIDKQIDAGLRQVAFLKELNLDELTWPLREAAALRMAHPESSYEELAAMLGISKSGFKNRLKRLQAIYETQNRE
ncbi:MAG: DNA-binding protein WhiA [Clostridiales bacterium]|nr:DNA-binding protein WhiA [Clostridiales bacterium]